MPPPCTDRYPFKLMNQIDRRSEAVYTGLWCQDTDIIWIGLWCQDTDIIWRFKLNAHRITNGIAHVVVLKRAIEPRARPRLLQLRAKVRDHVWKALRCQPRAARLHLWFHT